MARVVVTGVSSYTGACIAALLADRGHRVVGLCRRPAEAYEGLTERRLALARGAGCSLVFDLHAEAFPAWSAEQLVDVWIHHHHPMENFRAQGYDVGGAEQQVLASVPALMRTLATRGTRLVIYSSTYFEPGEGGQAPDAKVTPYAALKARIYEKMSTACAEAGLSLSRVVIPAPSGALENADRLTPSLLVAAEHGHEFALRSPDSIMDVIPGETLAESYASLLEAGLDGAEAQTRRPSGLATTAADWARRVDQEIAHVLGWQLKLNIPPEADRAPAVRFENPVAERVPVDWDGFFARYAADWSVR
jgi:nucleoside-diphosphate-sugar epimerase